MRCVLARDFTVGKALAWRSSMDENPPYQRQGSVWSLDKQQLFIDSILNGYDVPKIYLHDLRGKHPTKVYTIVDGKQRLTALWGFLTDEFPLAPDFTVIEANLPDVPETARRPMAGERFSQLDPAWKRVFRQTYLAVVLIQNATPDDIEDLFSRLNNGEPLNGAEKRNALGGDLARLIREIAGRPFFVDQLAVPNDRYQHLELAARFLAVEDARRRGERGMPDLRSRALDDFVRENRRLTDDDRADLAARVDAALDRLARVFGPADPLLATQAAAATAYLFVEAVAPQATPDPAAIRRFLESFETARLAELDKPEERQEVALIEFTHLMQHAANDPQSLARRVEILTRRFGRGQPADGRVPSRATG